MQNTIQSDSTGTPELHIPVVTNELRKGLRTETLRDGHILQCAMQPALDLAPTAVTKILLLRSRIAPALPTSGNGAKCRECGYVTSSLIYRITLKGGGSLNSDLPAIGLLKKTSGIMEARNGEVRIEKLQKKVWRTRTTN